MKRMLCYIAWVLGVIHVGCGVTPLKYDTLHEAAVNADLRDVKRHLAQEGIDVNAYRDYCPALHEAVLGGNPKVVELLIDHGAEVNAMNGIFNTPLHDAARYNRVEIARILIDNGAGLEIPGGGNISMQMPLHNAAEAGHVEMVALLISKGAHIDAFDWAGKTPLFRAVEAGHVEVARLLIDQGASLLILDNDAHSPLFYTKKDEMRQLLFAHGVAYSIHDAAVLGDATQVRVLLGKNPEAINNKSRYGYTPLLTAMREGHEPVIRVLLEAGSSPEARTNSGYNALQIAASKGYTSLVEQFLALGMDINGEDPEQTKRCPVEREESLVELRLGTIDSGESPLILAVRNRQDEMVKLLLEKGAPVDRRTKYGRAAIHYANSATMARILITHGADVNEKDGTGDYPVFNATDDEEMLKVLLQHGAKLDVCDRSGRTPLRYACRWGDVERTKMLLDYGSPSSIFAEAVVGNATGVRQFLASDPDLLNATVVYERRPIHLATIAGHRPIVELLLDEGADADTRDRHGLTPLMFASRKGHLDIMQVLLEHGAAINAIGRLDDTAFTRAVQNGKTEAARFLMERGADTTAGFFWGGSALHLAVSKEREAMVSFLLKEGFDPNTVCKWGSTPLHWAASRGNVEIVRLLLACGARIDIEDKEGKTPMDEARSQGNDEIVRLLKSFCRDE